jgi:O-methyltransferase domain/Dimerisation domain
MISTEARTMTRMINGFWMTQIVGALANFSVADRLAQGPATADEIADGAGTNPSATGRLLRACVALGLVTYTGGRFASTPLLETLRSDKPQSLRDLALVMASPIHARPWERFAEAVRTEQPQSLAAFGKPVFEHLAELPEESAIFTRAMARALTFETAEAVRAIDASETTVIADIGGAAGSLLHAVLQAHNGPRGIVFDLPAIVTNADAASAAVGLQDRVTAISGDFLDAVPAADLYLLRFILHDWDNAACVRILSNCRRAMLPGGRLVVIEKLLGPVEEAGVEALMDLNMMVMLGGRERSEDEFRGLLAEAGFALRRTTRTEAPALAVLEAVAA